MTDEQLQSLWEKSKQEEPKMNQVAINSVLAKSVRSGWSGLRINAWCFLAMLVVCEIFNLMNLAWSVSHPVWFAVHGVLTVAALGFAIFGIRVLRELQVLDDHNEGLVVLVRRQLRFFHTTFEWWLWAWALTVWMVSFCIPVWLENQRNGYRTEHVVEFVAVSAALVFGSYALFRIGHYPMVQRSLAALYDLEAQISDHTQRVQSYRKFWTIGAVVLFVAVLVAVVWTFTVWFSAMP